MLPLRASQREIVPPHQHRVHLKAGMRGLPSNGLGVGVEGLFLAEKHTQRQHQLAGPEEKVCKVVFRVDTLQQ